MFGGHDTLVDIHDNATQVRVVYSLKGASSYGMGSNGNMGITYENVDPKSGKDPMTKSGDNKYI